MTEPSVGLLVRSSRPLCEPTGFRPKVLSATRRKDRPLKCPSLPGGSEEQTHGRRRGDVSGGRAVMIGEQRTAERFRSSQGWLASRWDALRRPVRGGLKRATRTSSGLAGGGRG